jgi:hypothetical protein
MPCSANMKPESFWFEKAASEAPRPYSRGILKFFGGTRRSVSAFAEASADTRSAFIHGLTPVAFCEGG